MAAADAAEEAADEPWKDGLVEGLEAWSSLQPQGHRRILLPLEREPAPQVFSLLG